jgi:hypothetical protein
LKPSPRTLYLTSDATTGAEMRIVLDPPISLQETDFIL